jgi:hypothetical protein
LNNSIQNSNNPIQNSTNIRVRVIATTSVHNSQQSLLY